MAMLEFHQRRAIRFLIAEACERQKVTLDQHMIENMVNKRIIEIAEESATGPIKDVDWDVRVLAADTLLQEARAQKKALGLKYYHDDQEI